MCVSPSFKPEKVKVEWKNVVRLQEVYMEKPKITLCVECRLVNRKKKAWVNKLSLRIAEF